MMTLQTERLILKQINENHADDILKIRSNEVINRYVKRNSPKTNYDALAFILHLKKKTQDKEIIFWGISHKDHPKLIGTICLWNFSEDRTTAEVGYELLPDYHKKGIMSEAFRNVLTFGFNHLQLQKILAITNQFNHDSQTLLVKHGFALDEKMKDKEIPDNIIFSLKNPL